jgi:UDP-GlcNAc3NAcA epimerase
MLKKQCITLRKETEWVETLEGGCNTLVFGELERIAEIIHQRNGLVFKNHYGNGNASEEIVSIIEKHLI